MRRRKGAIKPKVILLMVCICGIICLAGIGYVWAKTEVYSLGRTIKTLEVRLDELHRTNDALRREFAAMCKPQELEKKVKAMGLSAPAPDQIVRIMEPVAVAEKAGEVRLLTAKLE